MSLLPSPSIGTTREVLIRDVNGLRGLMWRVRPIASVFLIVSRMKERGSTRGRAACQRSKETRILSPIASLIEKDGREKEKENGEAGLVLGRKISKVLTER